MKADANELCRVGHLLAQVELILHCVAEVGPCYPHPDAGTGVTEGCPPAQGIDFFEKESSQKGKFFYPSAGRLCECNSDRGMGSGAQAFGGGWC